MAGQKIAYAILAFENELGKLGELRYCEGGYFIFDAKGNIDHENQWGHIRMAMSGEGDPKSFAAKRAKRIRQKNTWSPTGEQLRQMISLVKKKA